jgi:hypothetical protein
VKFSRWILPVLLLAAILCATSVSPVDDPDTTIDESEFQVIFLVPSPLSIKFLHAVADSLDLLRLVSRSQSLTADTSFVEFMRVPNPWHAPSLHKLLCTFLI